MLRAATLNERRSPRQAAQFRACRIPGASAQCVDIRASAEPASRLPSPRRMQQGQAGPPDARDLVRSLLQGSAPRSDGPQRRSKAHPLYGSGGGASGGSQPRRSSGSQPSARRSKSQPPSPAGLSKVKPPRSAATGAAAAVGGGSTARRRGATPARPHAFDCISAVA